MFESKSATKKGQWIAGRSPRYFERKQRCPPHGLAHPEVSLDKVGCEYNDLSQIVMPEEDHCLRVMRPEHLGHERFGHFNVWIPLRCLLSLINFRSHDA